MDPEEIKFLNAWNAVPGVGAATLRALKHRFGSFEKAWRAGESAYASARLDPQAHTAIRERKKSVDPDRQMQNLARGNIWIVTDEDGEYPAALKEIHSPPVALYGRGDKAALLHPHPVAIVGTRRPTAYGREACAAIAGDLADAGVAIISGLAMGIDARAHETTLEHRGITVAVLGSGADQDSIFPPENRGLAERIVSSNGAVISEYAPATPAVKEHFPMRNRIIAGLARATVVVEAREKSGALITARLALEQNREVCAVPGSIFSHTSAGPHALIREGARAVCSARDIMEELGMDAARAIRTGAPPSTNADEAALLAILGEPAGLDEIRTKTGLPSSDILASLSLMELRGLVRNLGGGAFQKT